MDWNNEYSVGIHELDEQHRKLVECVSAVEQSARLGDGGDALHSALERLARLAEIHFAVEESLMRIHDYSLLDEHANEHHLFADRMRALLDRSPGAGSPEDAVEFLRGWVERHLPGHDKPVAFHFLKRAARRESDA